MIGAEQRPANAGSGEGVEVRGLYKLFGGDLETGIEMAEEGASKHEVLEATGSVLALSDVSFNAVPGEIYVVMGLSGCGKSTLIRCLNRLIEPDRGEVLLGNVDVTSLDNDGLLELRRTKLAMVFQHFGLMPHRNVIDNVAFGLELKGVDRNCREGRAEEAVQLVGLGGTELRMPDELSGGMRQRVGLARAFALDAPVMLMDEPFSALDPVIRRDLQEELLKVQSEMRKTVIFITHDLTEAARIGDTVAIIREGRIIQEGSPSHVVLHPKDEFVRDFTRDVRQHSLVTAESVMNEANHIVPSSAAAAATRDQMLQDDLDYTLVVDDDGRYLGTAGIQSFDDAVSHGVEDVRDVPLAVDDAVTKDAVLDEVVPIGLRADHCVPVLDDAGVLVGEVALEELADVLDPNKGNGFEG